MQTTEQNKKTVIRFNKEFIEQGNLSSFKEIISDQVINHAAPADSPKGAESMRYFLQDILRVGFPDLRVDILDQVAELDKVTTRKSISGTHLGNFLGIAATGKKVTILVIDIIRLNEGKYVEHWGASNIAEVVNELLK